ncbi:MAG: undecaprenyl/decaprenyl-phosphate alpha-N-acetylglucosaminyl 1-phosphate transferase [Oscillospiraceae bacterium]|nr:undecaprenyl/decaprenyl-phosphate alpha-N-acetylglucosaminyl 1-phosphate transferase [Oscillospiraceae bacterium]
MFPNLSLWLKLLLAFAVSLVISYFMTPPVKGFAEHVGAIDVPKDDRRVHDHPIPRMGGLAIFLGFVLSLLIFVPMDMKVMGLLLGALIIAVVGGVDDIIPLSPSAKLLAQFIAALVCVRCGIIFTAISNINIFGNTSYVEIGFLSFPLTIIWIMGCTNAVNLIDGLDGLAVGVSAISSFTMLVVSLLVSEPVVSIILAALAGACLGFMPFNFNPAKIFMGDVGSQFLGFVLGVVSIMGMFKFQAIITFIVPLLALAVPLADTSFAFIRRILKGQSPFHADKGHFHHRLMATGLSQKQTVAVLYGVSAIMGLVAVLISGHNSLIKALCTVGIFLVLVGIWVIMAIRNPRKAKARKLKKQQAAEEAAKKATEVKKEN